MLVFVLLLSSVFVTPGLAVQVGGKQILFEKGSSL